MKKLIIALLIICAVIAGIIYLNDRNRDIDLDAIFDEKPSDISGQSGNTTLQLPDKSNDTAKENAVPVVSDEASNENTEKKPENNDSIPGNANDTEDTTQNDKKNEVQAPENTTATDDKKDDVASAGNDAQTPEYEHTAAEKQKIIGRYIAAEEFYYSMLYQQFDLDSYDVIVRKNADGYNTEYHRVLYYDVNSVQELKEHYLDYFTEDFVSRLDMSPYIEENDKLYCAQVSNASSSGGAKYTYVVESIDKDNAVVVRTLTNGSGKQKINAVNLGGVWYFTSVAIK